MLDEVALKRVSLNFFGFSLLSFISLLLHTCVITLIRQHIIPTIVLGWGLHL
jgi:hypothetical protein